MNNLLSILVFMLAALLAGCHSVGERSVAEKEPIGLWSWLPEEVSTPANLSKAKVDGSLDEKSLRQLSVLVGRIANISHDVFRIESWHDLVPVAAAVYVPGKIIYCVRRANGQWEVAMIATVNV